MRTKVRSPIILKNLPVELGSDWFQRWRERACGQIDMSDPNSFIICEYLNVQKHIERAKVELILSSDLTGLVVLTSPPAIFEGDNTLDQG